MGRAAAFAERIGLPFRDLGLLEQALVHSSWSYEHPEHGRGHNERLEFLGDAVVDLAVAEALYARYPHEDEGQLSVRRASLVSAASLGRLAVRMDLGDHLLLGEGAAGLGERNRLSVLGRALEAVAGAIYLDLGWDAARDWIVALVAPELDAEPSLAALKSPKSMLQEWTASRTGERPQYRVLSAVGPDHAKLFQIEVAVAGEVLGHGEGPSRRAAETHAAAQAIEVLTAREKLAEAAP